MADGRIEEALNELRRSDGPDLSGDLILVLAQQRRIDDLRAIAKNCVDDGDEDEAPTMQSMTSDTARNTLARLLHSEGRTDETIALMRERDGQPDIFGHRAMALAELLAESGRVDEALAELRRPAQPWSPQPAYRHMAMAVKLLVRSGRHEELRQLAEDGWPHACHEWGKLLRDAERIDEAAEQFRAAASGAEYQALDDLGLMLTDHNRLKECYEILRYYAEPWVGTDYRARLAKRLAEQDRLGDLRRATAFGNPFAEQYLAALLAHQKPADQLARSAVSGNGPAAMALMLLATWGYLAHSDELRRFGLTPDGRIALDPIGAKAAIPTAIKKPKKDDVIAPAEISW